jgi:cadmium resistance protein CadD (predicted permease)
MICCIWIKSARRQARGVASLTGAIKAARHALLWSVGCDPVVILLLMFPRATVERFRLEILKGSYTGNPKLLQKVPSFFRLEENHND